MQGLSAGQIEQAKSVDLLAYLEAYEPQSLVKQGNGRYVLREHDSFVISNGKWQWWSRGFGGASALDFMMKVRGMVFAEAVQTLNSGKMFSSQLERAPPKNSLKAKPTKPFTLPPAHKNNDYLYVYLQQRGIDKAIIKACINSGTLYESLSCRCVFVGFDGSTPRFACERGIKDGYKKDVQGSDKRFGFVLPPKHDDSKHLAVTESAVDALAHATIHKMNGDKWDGHRLSLAGVSSLALFGFLERHSEVSSISLCLDNDKTGIEATRRIVTELLADKRYRHIKIAVTPPAEGKDYADTLGAVLQKQKEHKQPSRQKLAATTI